MDDFLTHGCACSAIGATPVPIAVTARMVETNHLLSEVVLSRVEYSDACDLALSREIVDLSYRTILLSDMECAD